MTDLPPLDLPPLCLHEQGELLADGDRLRPEVAEWCRASIGPVEVATVRLPGGSLQAGERTINLVIQLRVIRFADEADLIAYKLRWR